MKKILAILLLAGLIACGEQDETHTHGPASSTDPIDSLRKLVMSAHDVAMPKMGKLSGYQKMLTQQIDSLGRVGGNAATISRYEALRSQLAAAEKGMMDWMDQFDYEPELPADSVRLYFLDQQLKAEKMRDDVLAALDSAVVIAGK